MIDQVNVQANLWVPCGHSIFSRTFQIKSYGQLQCNVQVHHPVGNEFFLILKTEGYPGIHLRQPSAYSNRSFLLNVSNIMKGLTVDRGFKKIWPKQATIMHSTPNHNPGIILISVFGGYI